MNRSLCFLIFLAVVIPEILGSDNDCGPCKTSYDAETLSAVPSYVKGTKINCAAISKKKSKDFTTCKESHGKEFGYDGTKALKCCNDCPGTKNKGFDALCKEVKKTGNMPLVNCVVEQIRYAAEKLHSFAHVQKVVDHSADLMKKCCDETYKDSTCTPPN